MVDYIGIPKLCPFGDEMDFKKSYENYQHQSSSINQTFQSNFLCGPSSSSRAIPAGTSMECIMIHNDKSQGKEYLFPQRDFQPDGNIFLRQVRLYGACFVMIFI